MSNEPKKVLVNGGQGIINIRYGIKQLHVGSSLNYAVAMASQMLLILNLIHNDVDRIIRKNSYPRYVKLSQCQKILVGFFSDGNIYIFDTKTGNIMSKLFGVPYGVQNIVISGRAERILFGINSTVCLWNLSQSELQMASHQWRNINCYAIDHNGNKYALGTYSGSILLLQMIDNQKLTQITISRHTSCVMSISFSKNNQIFSVSYDRVLLTTTIQTMQNGQKCINYQEAKLDFMPRSIQAVGNMPYLYESMSIFWLIDGKRLKGFTDGVYAVCQRQNITFMFRYKQGNIQWFKM